MTAPISITLDQENAYRANDDAWMALLSGLTPADEKLFLQRLAAASGKGTDEIRAEWLALKQAEVEDRALRRVVRFFAVRHSPLTTHH